MTVRKESTGITLACPRCECESVCCVICGHDPVLTDEMIERGAEKIDDLLTMLAVDPDEAPNHSPSETVKRTLARAVLRAALEAPDA